VSTPQVISSRRSLGETGGRILRYTLSERVHHWLGAFTYIYCLITGLAFWSPYMYWLATLVGGGPTARFWHPWFGLGFTLSMFWMYKMWHRDMQTTDADQRWSKAMKYYIENQDDKLPPIGRFNYGQKLFFWLGIIATAAGIALAAMGFFGQRHASKTQEHAAGRADAALTSPWLAQVGFADFWVGPDFCRRIFGDFDAVIQDRDPLADSHHYLHVVFHQQN